MGPKGKFFRYHLLSQLSAGRSFLSTALWLILLVGVVVLGGCAGTGTYREEHQVRNLHIVFVDQQSLHQEWATRTGQPGVEFMTFSGQAMPSVKTVQGFFDFSTNTLYCPKWNFEVCGHELHHAVLGHFHKPH